MPTVLYYIANRTDFDINENYTSIQLSYFKTIGIDVVSDGKQRASSGRSFKLRFYLLCQTLILSTMLHYVWTNHHELVAISETFSILLQYFLLWWKVLVIAYKRKDIARLVQLMRQLTQQCSASELAIQLRWNERQRQLYKVYVSFCFMTVVSAYLNCLYSAVRAYWKSHVIIMPIPYQTTFIIDPSRRLNQLIILFVYVTTSYFTIRGLVAVDTFFTWSCFKIVSYFEILRFKLEQMHNRNSVQLSPLAHLWRCIEYQQKIYRLINNFNKIMRFILFMEFTIGATQISFIAYQITQQHHWLDVLFSIAFILAISTQLLLYCLCGQYVLDASDSIALSVYEAIEWDSCPLRAKQTMILMMMRSQRACILHGVFFQADLKLFQWIIQTAASYITLLKSL